MRTRRPMNAKVEMVRALQSDVRAAAECRFQTKEKELMTTKRAFTMLPNYSGKVEECENWRFQMIQFLSQDPYSMKFLEWIEMTWAQRISISSHSKKICLTTKKRSKQCV